MDQTAIARLPKDYRRLLPARVWLEPKGRHGMCLCWDYATVVDPSRDGKHTRVPSLLGRTVVRLPGSHEGEWKGRKALSESEGLLDEFIALGGARAEAYLRFAQRFGVPADHPLETWVSVADVRKLAWKVGALVRVADELHRGLPGEIADWAVLFGIKASTIHKARRLGRDWWDHLADVVPPRRPPRRAKDDWPEPGKLNVGRVIQGHTWDEISDLRFAKGRSRPEVLSGMVNRLFLEYHSSLSLRWEPRQPPALAWGSVTPNVMCEVTHQLALRILYGPTGRLPAICALPECTKMVSSNSRGRPRKYCPQCKKKADSRRKYRARRRAQLAGQHGARTGASPATARRTRSPRASSR